MTLKRFDLTLLKPISILHLGQMQTLKSREGFLLSYESESGLAVAEVSPLPGLSPETLNQVHGVLSHLDFHQIESDIADFLNSKINYDHFLKYNFLKYNFSHVTNLNSLKWSLCCLYSMHFRKKLKIHFSGKVHFQGLLQGSPEDILAKAITLENQNFEFAKIKVGRSGFENELLETLCQKTLTLRFRLDANASLDKVQLENLMGRIPENRIDFIEEPFTNILELDDITRPFGLDENIKNVEHAQFPYLKALVIKPTILGDFYSIQKHIDIFARANPISPEVIVSSSYESQVGLLDLCRLAFVLNPTGHHGLDTANVFLEHTASLETKGNSLYFKNDTVVDGPLYV